jgi:hypothetical protein
VQHTLPEGRAGATLDEPGARRIATAALSERLGLDAARGQVREVSASPSKLKARTDWVFTFVDTTIAPLPQGEPRIEVELAGDEVSATRRFVHVPEDWERRQRAGNTRNFVLQILDRMIEAALLVSAAVIGVIAWSRRRYAPRLFLAGAALMFLVSVGKTANGWPTAMAAFVTAAPLQLQVLGVIALGLVGLTLISVLVGLALGALPHRLAGAGTLPDRDTVRLGIAAGLVAAAGSAAAAALRTPVWGRAPDVDALGTVAPVVQAAIDPITRLLIATAVILATLLAIDRLTSGWTRRRPAGIVALALIGVVGSGVPSGAHAAGWLVGAAIMAVMFVVLYATLLRFDLTMVPLAVATMTAIAAVSEGTQRAYAGALPGSIGAAMLLAAVGWWWFRALRRARTAAGAMTSAAAGS